MEKFGGKSGREKIRFGTERDPIGTERADGGGWEWVGVGGRKRPDGGLGFGRRPVQGERVGLSAFSVAVAIVAVVVVVVTVVVPVAVESESVSAFGPQLCGAFALGGGEHCVELGEFGGDEGAHFIAPVFAHRQQLLGLFGRQRVGVESAGDGVADVLSAFALELPDVVHQRAGFFALFGVEVQGAREVSRFHSGEPVAHVEFPAHSVEVPVVVGAVVREVVAGVAVVVVVRPFGDGDSDGGGAEDCDGADGDNLFHFGGHRFRFAPLADVGRGGRGGWEWFASPLSGCGFGVGKDCSAEPPKKMFPLRIALCQFVSMFPAALLKNPPRPKPGRVGWVGDFYRLLGFPRPVPSGVAEREKRIIALSDRKFALFEKKISPPPKKSHPPNFPIFSKTARIGLRGRDGKG